MRRVVQFVRALASLKGLDEEEAEWVRKRLAPAEEALFCQMAPLDQKHAVDVARRAVRLARRSGVEDERTIRVLEKAALLHDVGKRSGEIGLFDRVVIVLVKRLAPSLARTWVERGEKYERRGLSSGSWGTGLCRAFYAQAVHAKRGASMAKIAGVEEAVIDLIRRHHQAHAGDPLLKLLQEADR